MMLIMNNLKELGWLNNLYYIRHMWSTTFNNDEDLKCKEGKPTLVVKYCATLTQVLQSILRRFITTIRKSFTKE
ncbi:hypothetical protein H5410_051536, partial [Solanum commersonii]